MPNPGDETANIDKQSKQALQSGTSTAVRTAVQYDK